VGRRIPERGSWYERRIEVKEALLSKQNQSEKDMFGRKLAHRKRQCDE